MTAIAPHATMNSHVRTTRILAVSRQAALSPGFLSRIGIAMSELNASLSYDPNRLLDTLLAWTGVNSDRKLSRLLQISPFVLRSIRAGSLPLRAFVLAAMAESVGKSIDELRRVLGERRRKARMSLSTGATC